MRARVGFKASAAEIVDYLKASGFDSVALMGWPER